MSERSDDERDFDAREAFALLGQEIRLDILFALLEHWRAAHTEPQSYSSLMRAVDMQDSGKFNYHLKRLRGVYVRKVEDGYVPTASATALYRAILATRPTEDAERSTIAVEDACPDCGGSLSGTYEGSFLTVHCEDCGTTPGGFTYPFPKNGLAGRDDAAVLEAVSRRASQHIELARSGQCPFCAGRTAVALDCDADLPVEIECDTCSFVVAVTFLQALKTVPRVTAALVALGIERDGAWDLPESTATVRTDDPLEIEVTIESDGRTAEVVVDQRLDVLSVTVDGERVGPER